MEKVLSITATDIFSSEQVQERQELFTDIFNRYYQRIFNYLYYRVGNFCDAEEMSSQVFEQVIAKMNSYSPQRAPFEVWLFTIARNVFNDHYRQQKRRPTVSLDYTSELIADQPGPEDSVINNETTAKLLAALEALPERDRNIIAMKFAGGLKNREIAKLTGLSESNVGVILYRSLQRLRNQMDN